MKWSLPSLAVLMLVSICVMSFVPADKEEALPLVATTIINGQQITLDGNDQEFQFEASKLLQSQYAVNGTRTAYVFVVSATTGVRVTSGRATTAALRSFPADSNIPIGFINGVCNIHVQGVTAGDVVAITYSN